MNSKGQTSSFSYFFMLFAIISNTCLLIRGKMVNGRDLPSSLVSLLISCLLTLILFIPVYKLNKKHSENIVRMSKNKSSIITFILKCIYIAYFFYASSYFMVKYAVFFSQLISGSIHIAFIIALLLFTSAYCAVKGFTILGRCGLIVAFFTLAVNLVVLLSSAPSIDVINYQAMDPPNLSDILTDTEYLSSILFILPICAVLIYRVKGKIGKNYLGWAIGGFLFTVLSIVMVAGIVGSYGKTQYFPVYTLAQSSKITILRGIDGVVFAMFTGGMFIILSLFIICLNNINEKEKSKAGTAVFCAVIFVVACAVYNLEYLQDILFNKYIILIANVISGTVIPLWYLITPGKEVQRNEKTA